MSKPSTPIIRTRLLRTKVGGHLSILITLPAGDMLEADVRASDRQRIEVIYNLIDAPESEQTFQTARVFTLHRKEEVQS